MEKFESHLGHFDNNVYGYHFLVDESIARKFIDGTNRRVLVTVNNDIKFRGGLMGSNEGWYILLNQKIVNQLNLEIGDKLSIVMEKDHSEYGMDMPEELQVLLDQDDEGRKYFEALTPGKQRNLIYLVNKVKSPDARLNKALGYCSSLE